MCVFHLASDVVVKKSKERHNESNRSQVRSPYRNKDSYGVDRASNFGTTAALPQLEKNDKDEEPFCFLRTNEKKKSKRITDTWTTIPSSNSGSLYRLHGGRRVDKERYPKFPPQK